LAHAIFTARRPKRGGRIASLRAFFGRPLYRCLAHVSDWCRRHCDRKLLQRLDERALRDLGIDRSLVEKESAVPFWRLH
jgi:uncharacterized protein YjiS (DUF1127 family)